MKIENKLKDMNRLNKNIKYLLISALIVIVWMIRWRLWIWLRN